jgi:transcriptional regulator with XRE-family HTH domain
MARSKTSDAVDILRRRFVDGDAEMEALVREERDNLAVAQQLYDLRTRANLTQQQLADLVGTTASVICRLEDADYEGQSLSMLRRLAQALQCRVEIRFIPLLAQAESPAPDAAQTGKSSASAKSRGRHGKAQVERS